MFVSDASPHTSACSDSLLPMHVYLYIFVFAFVCVCPELRSLHSCLNSCPDLCDLDLSYNQLTSFEPLDGTKLSKLKRLNLGQNRLTRLETMPTLMALEVLKLEGNQIESFETLQLLRQRCPSLKQLWLTRGSDTNPICQASPSYRLELIAQLPGLELLDGMRVDVARGAQFYIALASAEKEIAKYAEEAKKKANNQQQQQLTTKTDQSDSKITDWLPEGNNNRLTTGRPEERKTDTFLTKPIYVTCVLFFFLSLSLSLL